MASGKRALRLTDWKWNDGEEPLVFKGTLNPGEIKLCLPQDGGHKDKGLGTSEINPAIFMEEEEKERSGAPPNNLKNKHLKSERNNQNTM